MNMNKKNCNVGCPDCENVRKTKNNNKLKNNATETPKYTCAVCGRNYDTVESRIKCESSCLAELKEVEQKLKEEKLNADKKERYEHIKQSLSSVNDEVKAYLNDYGSIYIDTNYYYLNYIFNHRTFWL